MSDPFAAFERILRSGRLGEPVFLRCQVNGPPERAVQRLAETLAAAATVMGGVPDRLQCRGDADSGCLHAILVFRSGATVLVTTGPGAEAVDGMLLGNHGAAYGPGTPLSCYQIGVGSPAADASGGADRFREWLAQSLAIRQPISLPADRV